MIFLIYVALIPFAYYLVYPRLRAASIDACIRRWPTLYSHDPLPRWNTQDKGYVRGSAAGMAVFWPFALIYFFLVVPVRNRLEGSEPRVLSEWEKNNRSHALEQRIKELEQELHIGAK